MSVLLDAGPALSFLAASRQGVLIEVATALDLQLAAPRQVDVEVRGKSRDPRFKGTPVLATWNKLTAVRRLVIMEDHLNDEMLVEAVSRIAGVPAADRVRDGKSLGEIMVIAHASCIAQRGQRAVILMDEGDGRRRAKTEMRWLRARGVTGRVTLVGTLQLLEQAADQDLLEESVSAAYSAIRSFDDALPRL